MSYYNYYINNHFVNICYLRVHVYRTIYYVALRTYVCMCVCMHVNT